jgi:hypothetical protein
MPILGSSEETWPSTIESFGQDVGPRGNVLIAGLIAPLDIGASYAPFVKELGTPGTLIA